MALMWAISDLICHVVVAGRLFFSLLCGCAIVSLSRVVGMGVRKHYWQPVGFIFIYYGGGRGFERQFKECMEVDMI